MHPRLLTDGFELAKTEALRFLDEFAVGVGEEGERQEPQEDIENDRELLYNVARTSLRTKLPEDVRMMDGCEVAGGPLDVDGDGRRSDGEAPGEAAGRADDRADGDDHEGRDGQSSGARSGRVGGVS